MPVPFGPRGSALLSCPSDGLRLSRSSLFPLLGISIYRFVLPLPSFFSLVGALAALISFLERLGCGTGS
jgi:hypothetical protein